MTWGGRPEADKGHVCVHGTKSGVPDIRMINPNPRKGAGHQKGLHSHLCHGTLSIFTFPSLYWPCLANFHLCTHYWDKPQQHAAKRCSRAIPWEENYVSLGHVTLWHDEVLSHVMDCRTSHLLCIQDSVSSWEKILTVGQTRPFNSLWSQEISFLLMGLTIHHLFRWSATVTFSMKRKQFL